jgi:hypothetical protein
MRTIYKYELPLEGSDVQHIDMPEGAELLYVDIQPEVALHSVFVWALVDTDKPMAKRTLAVTGTGHPVPDEGTGRYVGSCRMQAFVWHVWEAI